MYLNQSLISFVFLFFSATFFAQYDVTNYTVEDGIISNDARGIWQDSKGIIWLVDEYGVSRFNGREIKSFVGKKKHFPYGDRRHFRKVGDTLFFTNRRYLLNGEYDELNEVKDLFKDERSFKYMKNDSVLFTNYLSFRFRFISQNDACFFFDVRDSSFYYSNSKERQKIIGLSDFGNLIPLKIDITNFGDDNLNKYTMTYQNLPWFLDNVGRFYLKIKGGRIVRYDKDFNRDTIHNVTNNMVAAFQTSSGRELLFSNDHDFKSFELDGGKLSEIAKMDALGPWDKKIRENNGVIYIGDLRDLFQLKNNKLSMLKEGVLDYEISANGTVIYVSDKSSSDVFKVHDLNRGETIIDKVQNKENSGKPHLFKDREKNIWVVSAKGFYKIVSNEISQKSIHPDGNYKAAAFDSNSFIFTEELLESYVRTTNFRSINNDDSAYVDASIDPALIDSKYLWSRYLNYETKNKVKLIRMNKENLDYSFFHLLDLNTENLVYPSNFDRFFFIGNGGFEIVDDRIERIYTDENDSCYLFVNGYQYYSSNFTEFTSPGFGKIVPNYLLITKKLALAKSPWDTDTTETPADKYLLFNTKSKEIKPFSFDNATNDVLFEVIIDKNTHCYFVREESSGDKDTATVKIFFLEGEDLKLVKKTNSELFKETDYIDLFFKTKDYIFFRNASRDLIFFNLESHELGTFETTKFNAGLINKVFPTKDENVFYINDLNKSFMVDFSNFKDKKDVEVLKTFDFNASGFYETKNQMYFGKGSKLLRFNKGFVPPIDSFPLYLNDVNVYDSEFNKVFDSSTKLTTSSSTKRTTSSSSEKHEFAYNENSITFYLEPVSHYKPKSIYLKYTLEGLHKNTWRRSSPDSVTIENLSPGTYTFKVKALNEDGIESNQIEYTFTIHPPFWETWVFRMIAVLLILGGIYGFYKYRLRKLEQREKYLENKVKERTSEVVKQKERAEHQHALVEEKNKEILDSINYAKRLQDAILPSTKIVSSYLVDSFIFYKPKDIVAGDFYFMDVIQEDNKKLVYYVAADCTGHGVPGAMVSIVGANGLKRCIQEFGLRNPGEILDRLAVLVADNFAQSEERIRDGMDLALCCLEMEENKTVKVHYAGANNPLWVINPNRKEVPKGAIAFKDGGGFEIKANKQAIGYTENISSFDTYVLDVVEGDTLYTFSDGFADQFGGPKGKKYKTANFKKFVVSIYNEPIEEQKKQIIEEFNNWKGEIDQVDDVCVIGVQL